MVRVLFIEVMPIRFQVRPKSARLMWTSASSQASPPWTDAAASKDTGRVRPRTVSVPVTAAPPARGLDTGGGEGYVRVVAAVEEVGRAQVRVAPGVLSVDGRRGHRESAAGLAVRRDGAVTADVPEDAGHRDQAHDLGLQPDAGLARIQDPVPGQGPVLQQSLQLWCDHLP